ncbi:MAG: hypothetical protein AB7G93_12315 [Bdellovibrionales bacterium]
MKLRHLVLSTCLVSGSATYALTFENAITLCSPPNNPLVNGLMAVGGNTFGNVTMRNTGTETIFTGDLVEDPSACNAAIMASAAPIAQFTLKMSYGTDGPVDRPLSCQLTVQVRGNITNTQPVGSTYCSK